jgi:hypothetical protein
MSACIRSGQYAANFNRQEDSDKGFRIGCSDYVTNLITYRWADELKAKLV